MPRECEPRPCNRLTLWQWPRSPLLLCRYIQCRRRRRHLHCCRRCRLRCCRRPLSAAAAAAAAADSNADYDAPFSGIGTTGAAEFFPIKMVKDCFEVNYFGYYRSMQVRKTALTLPPSRRLSTLSQAFMPLLHESSMQPGSRRGRLVFIGACALENGVKSGIHTRLLCLLFWFFLAPAVITCFGAAFLFGNVTCIQGLEAEFRLLLLLFSLRAFYARFFTFLNISPVLQCFRCPANVTIILLPLPSL
jgi:hypothetical protein